MIITILSVHGTSPNKKKDSTSKYFGVCWVTRNGKWVSAIGLGGKSHHLGYFDTELEAAIIYNIAARKYFREFANTNQF